MPIGKMATQTRRDGRVVRVSDIVVAFLVGAVTASAAAGHALAQAVPAEAAARGAFGCWRVREPEINVRARAVSYADVLAQARRGDILVKRKRSCSPKGVWCLVATASGVEGFVGRAAVEQVTCPAGAATAGAR